MIRRRPYVAFLAVWLVAATMARAHAQSWNLYSGFTSLPTIPYVGGAMSPTNAATVDLEVGATANPIPFVMDTGSTGIVVTPDNFTPGANDTLVGTGSQTYTSSGIVENGNFYLTNVVIYENANTPLATARVTVLEVTSETCLPNYPSCTPNPNPTGVAYMGVGFDRGASSTQPPAPYNNTNPFINIVSLASGQPVSSLAPGYMITDTGVTLGLSSSTTSNFAFVKLLPNTASSPVQLAPAWLQAPVTIVAGGTQSSGAILPDSGIDYAYLTPAPGSTITTTTTNPACKSSLCLAPNNTVQVYLPGQNTLQPAFYTFTTGTTGNALQPTTVSVNAANTTAFLNTGREFYAGFDYVYDPIGGYVGYRWNGTVSGAYGEVTPSAALIGNVNLPDGFSSSLPTVLYGATTLMEAGIGAISSPISGTFGLTIGSGQVVLTGASTYTGDTTVTAGTLEVDGSIADTSSVTVNSGGTLSGIGTVDPTTTTIMSGSTLAPGNAAMPTGTLTITGDLVFQPGAMFSIYVNPAASSSVNVSGAASLAGTVNTVFAAGSYVSRQYTILTAASGLGGTSFAGLTASSTGFTESLSYDADDVYLNIAPGFISYTGLAQNPQNVANTLTAYFNSTGGIPDAFFGLSAGALAQVDGEAATGAARGAFQIMTEFLDVMLNPSENGRAGTGWPAGGQASGFAPEQQASFPSDVARAYGSVLESAPQPAALDRHWSAWGSAFGGGSTTSGNAAAGTSNVTAAAYGFAGGMDYHFSPDTVVGFALAGGGTNWGLAQGLGGGRSDAFQVGLYGAQRSGPAYVAAALAVANHWMTTNRYAFGGDELTANFNAQSYAVRGETGYRFAAVSAIGVTPYAALQAQSFHTPSYGENDLTGGGFGLNYNAMTATDTRSELGARFDDLTQLAGMSLVLRGRLAWAHDWVSNPALGAVFETLPGTGFTVNGAAPPPNSALASVGADLHFTANWTLIAKFDSDVASGSQTYAGTGTLRYAW